MFMNLQKNSLLCGMAIIMNCISLSADPFLTSPGSGVGIATYPGENYLSKVDSAYNFLKSTQSPELDQVIQDIDVYCRNSHNPQNRIEWTTVDNEQLIALGCFQTNEMDQGKVITLKMNAAGQLVEAITSNIVIEIEKCKKRPTLYVAQTLTIGFGGVVGGYAAKKILNDGGDKMLHGGASTAMTVLFGSILHTRYKLSLARSATYAAIASCTVGALKEATDPKFGRVRESGDNKANLIGCAVGWILTYSLNRYIDSHQETFYRSRSGSEEQCRK